MVRFSVNLAPSIYWGGPRNFGILISHEVINIPINKTCSRALKVEHLPTKSMVLSSPREHLKIFTIAVIEFNQ